tara:strand:+ start:136 stop:585 length:450 start_codon:yes stop_codon:yes gene_type:complete
MFGSNNMTIKIPELLKSLTMAIASKQSMSPQLWEWLNMNQETFYKDVIKYVDLQEGSFTKQEIEEKILGGPGSEGLSSLMEFYQNEWTVIVEDDNGEEMEMLLYNAMQDNNVKEFKVNWKLEELDSNWNENEVNLIDEDDGFDLDYYEI